MSTRNVTGTGKDSDGDITGLCGPFGSVTKATAISDINSDTYVYKVHGRTKVIVVQASADMSAYLRTEPNPSETDNLDNLPDC